MNADRFAQAAATKTDQQRMDEISHLVNGCAFTVSNTLGTGFLEKVYENALAYEIRLAGLRVEQQKSVAVKYREIEVGSYLADLVVEDVLLVELKVAKALDEAHVAQCLNYLKATGLSVCLLLNFGKSKVEIKRLVSHF